MFKKTLAILGIVLMILQIINNFIDIMKKLDNRAANVVVVEKFKL